MKRFLSICGSAAFFVLTCGFAGAKLLLDWIGRVSAFQDIKDKDGYTAKALAWLFSAPTWVPSLCVVFALGAFLYVMYTLIIKEGGVAKNIETIKRNDLRRDANGRLATSAVFDQTHREGARYVFKTSKTLRDVEIYLEYSTFYGMAGGGWTQRNRVHLNHFDRVPRGESRTVYLIGLSSIDEQGKTKTFAKFGQKDENKNLIMKDQFYRCRIIFLDEDDIESYVYFIAYMQNPELGPIVLGQHLFDYSAEWEEGTEGDAEDLLA